MCQLLQLLIFALILCATSQVQNSQELSAEEVKSTAVFIDPYRETLNFYQGPIIEEKKKLLEVLMRLNPDPEIADWEEPSWDKKFFEESSSS